MYNKVTIIGNVGNVKDLTYTPKGVAVLNFSVASNKRNSEGEDVTTWFNCACWREQAENMAKYLAPGKQVFLEGEIYGEAYADKQGQPAYSLKVNVGVIRLLGKKDDVPAPAGGSAPRSNGKSNGSSYSNSDDIPF